MIESMGEYQRTESHESHDQSYVRLRSFGNRRPSRKVSSSRKVNESGRDQNECGSQSARPCGLT